MVDERLVAARAENARLKQTVTDKDRDIFVLKVRPPASRTRRLVAPDSLPARGTVCPPALRMPPPQRPRSHAASTGATAGEAVQGDRSEEDHGGG